MRVWGVAILAISLMATACEPATSTTGGSAAGGATAGETTGPWSGTTPASGTESGTGGASSTGPARVDGGAVAGSDDPETAACVARGGNMIPVCLDQAPMCVSPFPDAGRPCDDGDDCIGDCRATTDADEGERARGQCQATDYPCGCSINVESGRSEGRFCVD